MVRYILFLCLAFCCTTVSCKKNPETTKDTLSLNEKKSLVALAQLWGFLKYHHPAVAAGTFDWDMELIKRIPAILECKDELIWKKQLNDWVDSLPPIAKSAKSFSTLRVKVKPDYGELFNTDYFLPETIKTLEHILNNGVITSNHYVKVDNSFTAFTNESAYEDMPYPDSSYRLLALFRYWNIVNYFYPYRELCDQKWSEVLPEMLPVFIDAKDQKEYLQACRLLTAKIDDSHSYAKNNPDLEGRLQKPPFALRFIEDKLTVRHYTTHAPETEKIKTLIKIGDIVTKVNGEKVENIIERMLPYTPASNYAVKQRGIANLILVNENDSISITIQRDGKTLDLEVPCFDESKIKFYSDLFPSDAEAYSIIDNNIGLVRPSLCTPKNRNEGIKKVLNNTKGVIIDFRCYPKNDYISTHFLKHLNPTSYVFSNVTHADESYPGYFFIHKWYDENKKVPEHNPNAYPNKIVVIVDEYTQSAAEDVVLGFQTVPNTIVIGSQTSGADGSIVRFDMPGKIKMIMSGRGVYYPDGSNLQRSGVKIDEIVKTTIQGIKEGRDEMFERALAIINQP